MTITITMAWLKWAGLPLFILAVICLFGGNLPDHYGNPTLNGLRWIVWPLFLIWLVFIFVHGLIL